MRPAGLMKFMTGTASAISRLPSFLIGLLIIAVLAGGAFGAWRLYSRCGGQGLGACLLSAVNPIPASYGRGVGEPLRCAADEDMDAGLCYPRCQAGYKGIGPVCWQECPSGFRDDGVACAKASYGRGAGEPLRCAAAEDTDGGLCYPKCEAGYKGVGPVCWDACPSGFRDDGVTCAKPESYGRGGGYPWNVGDPLNDSGMFERCTRDHGAGNCEKSGAIVYPKCRANFHAVGCCVCSPDCPSGMTDAGVSCTKKSHGRGAGTPIHACADNMDKDGALCYPKCKAGFHGVGPVCWESKT